MLWMWHSYMSCTVACMVTDVVLMFVVILREGTSSHEPASPSSSSRSEALLNRYSKFLQWRCPRRQRVEWESVALGDYLWKIGEKQWRFRRWKVNNIRGLEIRNIRGLGGWKWCHPVCDWCANCTRQTRGDETYISKCQISKMDLNNQEIVFLSGKHSLFFNCKRLKTVELCDLFLSKCFGLLTAPQNSTWQWVLLKRADTQYWEM